MIHQSINQYLEPCFTKYHSNTAILYPEENLSFRYDEMREQIHRYARSLCSWGVKRNDHVAIILPTSPDWIFLFLAITLIGAVPVSLNDSDLQNEMEFKLNHSDTNYLFTTEAIYTNIISVCKIEKLKGIVILPIFHSSKHENVFSFEKFQSMYSDTSTEALAAVIAQTKYDDILNIQYTSGTTGLPKAVTSIHYSVLNNILVFLRNFHYTEQDKIVAALPLYHVMGCLFTGILTFLSGGCLVLISHFHTKEVLNIIQTESCTSFHGVPTMFRFMLNRCSDYNISSLTKCMIAGDYCGPSLIDAIHKELKIDHPFPCYGQSEGIGITQALLTDSINKIKYTVGKAVDQVIIKIIDDSGQELPHNQVGEIIAYIPYHMLGYYKDPDATRKTLHNDWLYTGDLGYLDDDNYLVLKGRKKEIIVRGGENISPVEIENVIRTYEPVENVAVIGISDSLMGQEIAAYITISPKHTLVTEEMKESLDQYLCEHLPKYKRPKFVYFIDHFPMTTSGKIQKHKLIQLQPIQTDKGEII
ncbi:O-succinylbenzoic acid--CoA ligase [Lachnospiraceae bacterium KM106-2]|nr:O-succinylbenzoic acid--CoA ligase [Lachnospiraceae bacterium KM106-2]